MIRNDEIKIRKPCPNCGWRLFDKVSPTSGTISIKCPQCKKVVKINLSYRRGRENSCLPPMTHTSAGI